MPGSDEVTCSSPRPMSQTRRARGWSPIVALSFAVASVLSACSGIKTYDNSATKNLYVRTATDSGSWFSSVRTAVDIHRVSAKCSTEYEGTVQLAHATTEIGLPPERWSRLVFVFATSSFFANRSGTVTYETLLKPRPHHRYDVTVSYRNDMYHVVIREVPPNRSTGRELDRIPLSTCGAPSASTQARTAI